MPQSNNQSDIDSAKTIKIAFVGQPNVGKSSLLNALSGADLKIGNFSGTTIEQKQISLKYKENNLIIIDLPGIYSLSKYSPEEEVTKNFLENSDYDLIVNIVDSTNLDRNLALTAQMLELDKKTIIALNMIDEAKQEGINIDSSLLGQILGVSVVPISAAKKINLDSLLDSIIKVFKENKKESKLFFSEIIENELQALTPLLDSRKQAIYLLKNFNKNDNLNELESKIQTAQQHILNASKEHNLNEIFLNEYIAFANGAAKEVIKIESKQQDNLSLTQKLDSILLSNKFGIPIFLLFMFLLFQATFFIGGFFKDYIEDGFLELGELLKENIQIAWLGELLSGGVINGVGVVLSFLPLIIILYIGIAFLEGSGYMSRVAFLLDGVFHKFGLHGKSFIPLVSGFGCSVPAYMAARTLKNKNERLITMFVIGFMSCSARLPIYVLFIGAFFSSAYAGLILFCIYLFGALVALVMAKFLKLTIFKGKEEPFVMEMPKYRLPSFKTIYAQIKFKVIAFLKNAGGFILLGSILIWFLSNYPHSSKLEEELESKKIALEHSGAKDLDSSLKELNAHYNELFMKETIMGRIGMAIEPIFRPMDFDWRLSVSLVAGFAAKEIVVSSLGVLYGLDEENLEANLESRLKESVSFPSAIAFIVIVMFYIPCFAASISFGKEAGGAIFVLYLFIFTSIVAYLFGLMAYLLCSLFVSI